jgi:hypothetical protein
MSMRESLKSVFILPENLGSPRQLKGLYPMRFEIMAPPDVAHRGLTRPLAFRHEPTTPLRHPLRLGRGTVAESRARLRSS